MTRLILPALFTMLVADGQAIATKYPTEVSYRVAVTSQFSMETVDFSMERDGEPMEGGRGGDMRSEQNRTIVMVDTILESKDGEPTRVRRTFENLDDQSLMTFGENERANERECPLNEVVLELSLEDGEVKAEVLEGDEPDDERLLEGHHMTLALDALLPQEEVEADDSWKLEGEDLLQAMGFDLENQLFPQPTRDEGEGDGEGRRGGRGGGRRGGGMMGGGNGAADHFIHAEWEVEAKLIAEVEEYEGVECHVISLEAEGTGELPEPEMGGGRDRDRQDQSFALLSTSMPIENSFEIELEGKLYFSVEGGHPLHFEVEGKVATESLREMERRDSFMVISISKEGTFEYSVDVSSEVGEGDEEN